MNITEQLAKTKPTGPTGWRNKLAFWRDPLNFTIRMRQYGELVRWLDWPSYFLNNPTDIELIMGKHQLRFDRNFRSGRMHKLLGNGLLSSSGDFWLRQRRMTQPVFHHERVAAYGETMTALTTQLLAKWQVGQIRNIHSDMMQLTLDVVAQVFFSYEDSQITTQVGEAFDDIVRLANWQKNFWQLLRSIIIARLSKNTALTRLFPALKHSQLQGDTALARLDEVVYEVIRQRRRLNATEQAQQTDLLGMLMQVRDETGQGMTDQQLRDEVLTMFIAGHETTAVTLSWTFYLLDKHPHVQEKLLSELNQVLAGRLPTAADLPHLTYLEKVVKETLRLYPPL